MKQEAFVDPAGAAPETDARSPRKDPQRLDRAGSTDELATAWPADWAWEEDNQADGLGVGPFPTPRKPPKRATRAGETAAASDGEEAPPLDED